MEKRLYRSRKNAMIGGVCGGIAEYLDVDPTLVRIIWAISSVYGGIGVIAYLVCFIVVPEDRSGAAAPAKQQPGVLEEQGGMEKQSGTGSQYDAETSQSSERNRLLAGTLLICLGGLLLFRRWFYLLDIGRYWPVLLIAAGLIIIINGTRNKGESR